MTMLNYRANSNSMLSFKSNQEVRIISKPKDGSSDLWGVEINGKRGFVNRRHLREMRVLVKDPMFLPGQEAPPPQEPVATPPKLPDATTETPSAAKAEGKPVETIAPPPVEVPKPEPSPEPVPAVPEKAPEPSKAVQPPESQEPVQQETQAEAIAPEPAEVKPSVGSVAITSACVSCWT